MLSEVVHPFKHLTFKIIYKVYEQVLRYYGESHSLMSREGILCGKVRSTQREERKPKVNENISLSRALFSSIPATSTCCFPTLFSKGWESESLLWLMANSIA